MCATTLNFFLLIFISSFRISYTVVGFIFPLSQTPSRATPFLPAQLCVLFSNPGSSIYDTHLLLCVRPSEHRRGAAHVSSKQLWQNTCASSSQTKPQHGEGRWAGVPSLAEELLAGDSFCESDSPFPPSSMGHQLPILLILMFSPIFLGFGMLTVLRSTGQVFYRMSLSWDLLDTFLIISWKLLVLGENSRNSHEYCQNDFSVSTNLDYLT